MSKFIMTSFGKWWYVKNCAGEINWFRNKLSDMNLLHVVLYITCCDCKLNTFSDVYDRNALTSDLKYTK